MIEADRGIVYGTDDSPYYYADNKSSSESDDDNMSIPDENTPRQ